jgi:hypothetical protein
MRALGVNTIKNIIDVGVIFRYVSSELPLPRKRLRSPQQLRRVRQASQGKGRIALLRKVSKQTCGV